MAHGGSQSKIILLNISLAGVRPSGFYPVVAEQKCFLSTKCRDRAGLKPANLIFCNGARPQDFIQLDSLGLTPPCMSTLYQMSSRPRCASHLSPCRRNCIQSLVYWFDWAFEWDKGVSLYLPSSEDAADHGKGARPFSQELAGLQVGVEGDAFR